jgi:hypothetical protein
MRILNELLTENKDFDLFNHSIILGYVGSISHGTYIPNYIDDKDVMGIIVPPIDYFFGLKEFGSRNTLVLQKKYWDVVLYDIRKFVFLLLKNNPNVLGLLWLPEDLYLRKTLIGDELIKNRDLFSSKLAYNSFCGYAYSQLKRMEHGSTQGYMGEKRKELIYKWGFDCSNASHLIRLLEMGIEFLKTGQVNVFRKNKSKLIEIKKGLWTLEQVKNEANRLFKDMEDIKDKSVLPDKPNYKTVNELLIDLLTTYFK